MNINETHWIRTYLVYLRYVPHFGLISTHTRYNVPINSSCLHEGYEFLHGGCTIGLLEWTLTSQFGVNQL